jgi:hypothetical protein
MRKVGCKARAIGRKLDCLNPNRQRCNRTRTATASTGGAAKSVPFKSRGAYPAAWQAIASEAISGDEGDAYVALDTFSTTGTRDRLRGASPKATESPS